MLRPVLARMIGKVNSARAPGAALADLADAAAWAGVGGQCIQERRPYALVR